MFHSMQNSAQAYANVGIETEIGSADSHKLILLLFDGALLSLSMAKAHMNTKNIEEKGMAISKAINIITNGLNASLNPQVNNELVERLQSLYNYMAIRLVQANLHNQPELIDEVVRLLEELRSAWAEIAQDPAVVSWNRAAA